MDSQVKMSLFDQLSVLGELFVRPRTAMRKIVDGSLWIVPLVIAALLNVLTGWMTYPFASRVIELAIPAGTPAAGIEALHRQIEFGRLVLFVAAPVIVAVECLLTAGVLWLFANAFIGNCRFKQLFAIVAHGNLLRSFVNVYGALVLCTRNLSSIHTSADLNVPFGLDAFVLLKSGPVVQGLLGRINPLEIAYLVFVAIGLSALYRVSRTRGAAVSLGHWVTGLGFQAFIGVAAQMLRPQ